VRATGAWLFLLSQPLISRGIPSISIHRQKEEQEEEREVQVLRAAFTRSKTSSLPPSLCLPFPTYCFLFLEEIVSCLPLPSWPVT
jgi:hypothetical protein